MPRPTTNNFAPPTDGPCAIGTRPHLLVTTSWDDGSPSDLRLAELLARYDLPATFYVPRQSQRPTMSPADLRQLATAFEIGGHTLHHVALRDLTPLRVREEVYGCMLWLQDVTGNVCRAFCPPLGQFRAEQLTTVRKAGFRLARTVELLSVDRPRACISGLTILPTSVQAYPHCRSAYLRNALRRKSATNLLRAMTVARSGDWVGTLKSMIDVAAHEGGVIHLWGHSWEIDETGQWAQLEEAFRLLRDHSLATTRFTNSALVAATAAATASAA
jgi:peptidoglycan/xylan/chitin deacetylase (PgdA/CDA1 family)